MISKIGLFKDKDFEKQVDEIVAKQFANQKEVSVTFTAANQSTKVDVGQRIDKFIPVWRDSNIAAWLVTSDDRYAYFKATGAGKMKFIVWKGSI